MLNLNLGCGAETIDRPGWVNVDLEPRKPHVVKGDVLALDFPDGSADMVVTSHVLEHLDVPAALAEWKRVLKPGGECLAVVPDAAHEKQWIGFHLAEAHERGGGEAHHHKADLTQESLEQALRDAGFVDVVAVDPDDRWELPGKAWWQAAASGRKAVTPCA